MTLLLRNTLFVLALAGISVTPTWSAQSGGQDNTVLVRFSVDPVRLSEVRDSKGLMAALHDALSIYAATPLESTINIHIGFRAFQSRSDGMENMGYDQTDPRSITGSGIFLDVDRGNPLDGRVRDLRFYTFGDQSETEAWDFFRNKVESALAYSLWSSHAFQPGGNNNIPLKVDDVTDGTTVIEPDGKRMVLEITAETLYRDGSKFGCRTPPEGCHESLETVQIVLSPREADEVAHQDQEQAPGEAPAPAAPNAGGVIGVYGIDNRRMVMEEIDGQLVFYTPRQREFGHCARPSRPVAALRLLAIVPAMTRRRALPRDARSALAKPNPHWRGVYNGNMAEPTHWKLAAVEANRYGALYYDTPVEIHFSVDENGRAFAMSIVQQGNELKLPRKE